MDLDMKNMMEIDPNNWIFIIIVSRKTMIHDLSLTSNHSVFGIFYLARKTHLLQNIRRVVENLEDGLTNEKRLNK
jgi:hypothetical protein